MDISDYVLAFVFWLIVGEPPGLVWVALAVAIFVAIAGSIGESLESDRRDRRHDDNKTPPRR